MFTEIIFLYQNTHTVIQSVCLIVFDQVQQ
jgi:hypothetical protein